ncbi:hypothetical protein Moror_12063 [Moniliophthora roreri MCA 2997]|uniref:Uncharacterized protein n=2 Tax=Moniliophthora roreri TaxID=221103 RepID=V2XW27_MONRO|nr:hypothetical protein Moror_12063 [Moniliophthora roreri MCA 2997]
MAASNSGYIATPPVEEDTPVRDYTSPGEGSLDIGHTNAPELHTPSCGRCLARNLPCLKDTSPKTNIVRYIPCGKSRLGCSLNNTIIARKRKAPALGNAGSRSPKRLRSDDARRRSTRARK